MKRFILEIDVFAAGAVVMIFELAGSRALAPYVGTSLFVWTSLIGVILGSLSLGYYLGGILSDRNASLRSFSVLLLLSGIFMGISTLTMDFVLSQCSRFIFDVRWSSLISCLLLFSVPSVFLGMITPYAMRMAMTNVSTSGKTVGRISAFSTLGSIFGTFTAGFFLIPFVGTTNILFSISLVMIGISMITSGASFLREKLVFLILITLAWSGVIFIKGRAEERGFLDVDTLYHRVWIYESKEEKTGRPILRLVTNKEMSSAMYLDTESSELPFLYLNYYRLAEYYSPEFRNALMIGGGGYAFPKYFLEKYPEASIDVIEIDPGLTELAKKYFRLVPDPRLTIFHEDGRIFLNRNTEKYDVIYGDAFRSFFSIPYHLTTQESIEKMYGALNDQGVVILNVIGSFEGEGSEFLRAEYRTFASVFPEVDLYPVRYPNDPERIQNIMLVAAKGNPVLSGKGTDSDLQAMIDSQWEKELALDLPILTDDFAPTDYYISRAIRKWSAGQ